MEWHLAPSLGRFRQWIHSKFPKHVGKNREDDGSIGDASHAARTSDHNPNVRHSVNAIDEDEDGLHMPTVLAAAMVHGATSYVIWERVIWKARNLFKGEVYTGVNAHMKHGHISIWQTVKAEQSKTPWGIGAWPTLMNGSTGRSVSELQAYLNVYWCVSGGDVTRSLSVDGHFGDRTENLVRWYQEKFAVTGGVDGLVGPHTEYDLKTRRIPQNP